MTALAAGVFDLLLFLISLRAMFGIKKQVVSSVYMNWAIFFVSFALSAVLDFGHSIADRINGHHDDKPIHYGMLTTSNEYVFPGYVCSTILRNIWGNIY